MHESEEEVTDMKLPYYFYWLKMPLQLHLKDYSLKSIKKKKKWRWIYFQYIYYSKLYPGLCISNTLINCKLKIKDAFPNDPAQWYLFADIYSKH